MALDTVGGVQYLYVSEHGDVPNGTATPPNGGQILKINLSTGTSTVIATRGTGNGQFISPDAILVDPATHNLFIADRWLNRVQQITNTGAYVMQFGTGTVGGVNEMHGPVGLARDSSGAIYVSEHGDTNGNGVAGNVVGKYTISGTTATQVWRKGNSLDTPYSVAVNGSNLYISDGFHNRVQVWDLNGNPIGSFPITAGAIALGSSFDSAGNFWIAEAGGDYVDPQMIVKRNPANGTALLTFGSLGTGNGQFQLVFDVAVDAANNKAYAADYHNNRVQVIDLAATQSGVPVINSSATAAGTVGQNFSYTITATNSPTSYAVDASTPLPSGLSLSSNTIVGIPNAAGTTTVKLTATNGSGTSAPFNLAITIGAAAGGTPGTPALPIGPSITFFDIVVPTGGSPYVRVTFDGPVAGVDQSDFVVNSQGGANASITSFGVDSTTPNSYALGFTFSNQDGWVQFGIKTSGTGITGGGNAFRGAGRTTSRIWGSGPTNGSTILDPATANVTAGTATGNNVNFTVTYSAPVTGVTADDFIITGTSANIGTPTGSGATWTVPVTASGTGSVTLTPIGGATANVRDAANNWFGGATNSATATITGGSTGSAPTISAQTASGTVGTAMNYQVVATGATSYSVSGTPALPAGLSLNATTGVVTGTPTASGTTAVNIQATNANGSNSAVVTFNIAPASTGSAPTISAQSASGTVGTAMNYQVVATGATSYSVSGTPALPAGLTLNATTGVVTGTPTASGTTAVNIQATNANGSNTAVVTFNIAPASTGSAPTISAQSASGTVGTAMNYQVVATGATSYSVSGTPALPAGLTLNATTGVVTGTPTASGTTAVNIKATNANGSNTAVVTFNIAPASTGSAPTISAQSASGTVGTAMNYQVVATGATSYSVSGTPALPAGLSLNATTGAITGTPTAAGTTAVNIKATNANGSTTAVVTITVTAATPSTAPVVTSATVNGTVGALLQYNLVISNSPDTVTATGIPVELTLKGLNLISGYPMTAGTFPVTVRATNSSGTGTGTVTFVIAAAPPPPPPVTPPPYNPPPSSTPKAQTVTFNTPTSSIIVNQAFRLSALADSGGSITYSLVSGNAVLNGDTLTIKDTKPVVVRAAQAGDSTWAAATADTTFTAQKAAQSITLGSNPTKAYTDGTVALKATSSSGLPITYTVVSGPATISGSTLTFTGTGPVVIRAAQTGNDAFSSTDTTMTINGAPIPRLINISSRVRVTANDANGASIAGFVVTGTSAKQILIRAVGPSLSSYGISSPLANPTLKLFDSKGAVVASNTGWANDSKISAAGDGVGAFTLKAGSADSALLVTLQPGAYTAQVTSTNNSGTVLIEVYDVTANAAVPTKQLINISTRGTVGTADDVLVGGFVVSGTEPKRVLVRAIGPGLATYGVSGVVADPVLKIYNSSNAVIAQNDNWGTAVKVGSETPATSAEIIAGNTAAGAFPLVAGSADAAVILTLNPGNYTAVVTGANNSSGAALMEIYELPNL